MCYNKIKTIGGYMGGKRSEYKFDKWCIVNNQTHLLDEWDYKLNNVKPEDLWPKQKIKLHWKCKFGHKWEAYLSNRTSRKSGCPHCARAQKASFSEKSLYFYIKKFFKDAIPNYKTDWLKRKELDIYIFHPKMWHWNMMDKHFIRL